MSLRRDGTWIAAVFCLLLASSTREAAAQLTNDMCLGCHGNASFAMPRRDGEMRPGLLFVHLAEPLRGPFNGQQGRWVKYFSEQLSAGVTGGVNVRIEGEKRPGARR